MTTEVEKLKWKYQSVIKRLMWAAYCRQRDLCTDLEYIETRDRLRDDQQTIRAELLQHPEVGVLEIARLEQEARDGK